VFFVIAFLSRSGDGGEVVRLRNVLYWTARLVTAPIMLLALYGTFFGNGDGRFATLVIFAGGAVLIWLAGRATRYVPAER